MSELRTPDDNPNQELVDHAAQALAKADRQLFRPTPPGMRYYHALARAAHDVYGPVLRRIAGELDGWRELTQHANQRKVELCRELMRLVEVDLRALDLSHAAVGPTPIDQLRAVLTYAGQLHAQRQHMDTTPRHWRHGDPEPGPEITTVRAYNGRTWVRHANGWLLLYETLDESVVLDNDPLAWHQLTRHYGPVTEVREEAR
ncbi:hypothetical protein GCM10012275_38480 [Longimycelium tulufanense]|uniref:Uncharacterized protein n=1 Tax=Longimycelium tulufanense TaxID=907463 RepID=A0A8J3FW82_9PSEU|nr:hypothetical protein [Longimycelium tulufanense]GGM64233.1 hypothetical protein GCM10012275_38480 [Longimycelium tulufanense]